MVLEYGIDENTRANDEEKDHKKRLAPETGE
jgi:hypothetical protein